MSTAPATCSAVNIVWLRAITWLIPSLIESSNGLLNVL